MSMGNPHGRRRCYYCTRHATYTYRVGSTVFAVCDDTDCNVAFDEETREAEQDADAFAREAAVADDFARYR